MANHRSNNPNSEFRYRRRLYKAIGEIRHGKKLYLIIQDWGSRYQAFDTSVQAMRSIRVRKAGVKREMSLMKLARIRDNHLPHVYDYFTQDGNEYLVQEWLDGYDLRHYLRLSREQGEPWFDAVQTYRMIRGLVSGIKRIHEYGIFHGDLKPGNLIVTAQNRLVMIDFGAAWSSAWTQLRPDEMEAGYASPEQWMREKLVDHRADQFSLSVMLYEMLTGELPYNGRGGFGSDYSRHPKLVLPSKKNKAVWPELDHLVATTLSLDKSQRFDTSTAWLAAFNAASPPERKGQTQQGPLLSPIPGGEFWKYLKDTLSKFRPGSK